MLYWYIALGNQYIDCLTFQTLSAFFYPVAGKIKQFAYQASIEGKSQFDFEAFAREWNFSADGADCF